VDRQILSEDNASFAYKGNAVDIKHVGRELGVRYVLEVNRPGIAGGSNS